MGTRARRSKLAAGIVPAPFIFRSIEAAQFLQDFQIYRSGARRASLRLAVPFGKNPRVPGEA